LYEKTNLIHKKVRFLSPPSAAGLQMAFYAGTAPLILPPQQKKFVYLASDEIHELHEYSTLYKNFN